jgi:hypothetical protein
MTVKGKTNVLLELYDNVAPAPVSLILIRRN